jgi:hypothetical protein
MIHSAFIRTTEQSNRQTRLDVILTFLRLLHGWECPNMLMYRVIDFSCRH